MSLITSYAVMKLMSGKMKPIKTKVIGNIISWLLIALILLIRLRRKTPCFSYGDIRRSETKFLLKG